MVISIIQIDKFKLVRLMGIILFCMTILSSQVMKIYGMIADVAIEEIDSNLEDMEEKEDSKEKESNLEDFIDFNKTNYRFTMLTKLCFRTMLVKYGLTNIEVISPPPEVS